MINVLSLFDGMSCGQIALKKANIKVSNYIAGEIDKHAIKVTKKNFPNTVHLGDVKDIKGCDLPFIDLIIGGSPCQGFSFAGKQLNFSDPRSALFFEFVRIWKELRAVNPDIKFLLENVRMKKEYVNVISEQMGVSPILINGSLVSGQNRRRLFWTNIEGVDLPEDKGIFVNSILENNVDTKYLLSENWNKWLLKNKDIRLKKKLMTVNPEKAITMTARQFANWSGNFIKCNIEGGVLVNDLSGSDFTEWDNLRKLTPVECERLQNVPDNYTSIVSDSQRYKMLGNGWTVDVIAHILSFL